MLLCFFSGSDQANLNLYAKIQNWLKMSIKATTRAEKKSSHARGKNTECRVPFSFKSSNHLQKRIPFKQQVSQVTHKMTPNVTWVLNSCTKVHKNTGLKIDD